MHLVLVFAFSEGDWLIRKGTKNGNRNNAKSATRSLLEA